MGSFAALPSCGLAPLAGLALGSPKKRVSPRAVSAAVGPSRPLEGGGQGALVCFRAVGALRALRRRPDFCAGGDRGAGWEGEGAARRAQLATWRGE